MKRHGPWRVLGLDPTDDRAAIRRAYADKLRGLDVDRDIEAYTRLRGARDRALALARSTAAAVQEAREPALADADGDEGPAEADRDEASAPVSVDERPEAPVEPAPPSPPQVLLAILFPHGEASEEPLTPDELAVAEQALAAILEEAGAASIDEQAGIEDWLAHHLASAWPRSAWLVEQAAETFGWLDESGQLGERPAVEFLNQRLKGMRFTAKVQQPDHPLHKAWVELAKPGSKGSFGFLRASKGDVRLLLAGIRERYPEVEGHLDPERVGSWEAVADVAPSSAWYTFVLIAGAATLLRLCAGAVDSSPPRLPPPVVVSPPASALGSTGWSRNDRVLLIDELFGEPFLVDTLRNEAPDVWSLFEARRTPDGLFADEIDESLPLLVQEVRLRTQIAAIDADFQSLVAIKQIKLELMRAAWTQGGTQACLDFARTLRFPPEVEVPPGLRDRERKVAAHLVEQGLFRRTTNEFPQSAAIPGSVVEEVARSTGFAPETTAAAARNNGSVAIQCEYRIALLEAILRRPSEVPADLLRLM